MKQVDAFISSQVGKDFPKSSWLKATPIDVYMRAGKILNVDGKLYECICIANIAIHDDRKQGKGHYKRFIEHVESFAKVNGYEYVKLEQVLNPHLLAWSLKHGYVEYRDKVNLIKQL